jgi:hypothetical protein
MWTVSNIESAIVDLTHRLRSTMRFASPNDSFKKRVANRRVEPGMEKKFAASDLPTSTYHKRDRSGLTLMEARTRIERAAKQAFVALRASGVTPLANRSPASGPSGNGGFKRP